MPFAVAGILGAATLGGSLISGGAASDAASIQAGAANRAADVQRGEFQQVQNNLTPFLQIGGAANQSLASLLGLNFNGLGAGGADTWSFDPNSALLQNPLSKLGAPPQYNMPEFTAQMYQQSPGYNATLQGGTQALQNAGATKTGALSGNVLKALQGAGTQLANTDFQQGYQNYATNYFNQFGQNNQNYWKQYDALNQGNSNTFNWLQMIAGAGQNAGANLGSLGNQSAGNIGNALIGAGNAQAAGTVGAGNAAAGGLNSLATMLASPTGGNSNSLLAALLSGNSMGGNAGNVSMQESGVFSGPYNPYYTTG